MTDPIKKPDFNLHTYREPNPETIKEIERIADDYHSAIDAARDLRSELDDKLRAAKAAGHSWGQLRDASGFSVAALQAIIGKG